MIASALMQLFNLPPDLGGLVPNYPVVDNSLQRALFSTQRASWEGPDGVGYSSAVEQVGNQSAVINGWTFEGDVYSVQMQLRLGSYIAPDILGAMILDPDGTPYG